MSFLRLGAVALRRVGLIDLRVERFGHHFLSVLDLVFTTLVGRLTSFW